MCAKLLQSCPTLCNLTECSPSGSSVHGILQQVYCSGLPCRPPGDLPNPWIETVSLISPTLAGRFFTTSTICTLYVFNLWMNKLINKYRSKFSKHDGCNWSDVHLAQFFELCLRKKAVSHVHFCPFHPYSSKDSHSEQFYKIRV